jgi:hypothetical protein
MTRLKRSLDSTARNIADASARNAAARLDVLAAAWRPLTPRERQELRSASEWIAWSRAMQSTSAGVAWVSLQRT